MTTTSKFKYLDPDIYDPQDFTSPEAFSVDEAMGLWNEAADVAFHEYPEDGTTCEECSEEWDECECPDGATYDSDVFFNHDDVGEVAGLYLSAWEYSKRLPKENLPEIDRSSDIWHGITILVKHLEDIKEQYREDLLLVRAFVDEWAPKVEETEGE